MISTGIKGLDTVINGLRAGDNVVWQIDDMRDYAGLVKSFVGQAMKEGKRVVYIRFASHKELISPSKKIERHELDANEGFESFTTTVNAIITGAGEGAYYVFDCLSELLSAWASDLMISNFFQVTCPYLYELKTFTYFSIMRNQHSFKSIAQIRETTQLLMDVYKYEGELYIHPLKVWNRYSPTMFLPHQIRRDKFVPISDSVNAVKVLSYIRERGADSAKRNLDYWDRMFLQAGELAGSRSSKAKIKAAVKKLSALMISADRNMLSIASDAFSLEEIIDIKSRLVGTGFIGGKSAGMLIARKMLSGSVQGWKDISEPHDSFYIGSDIFYSYIVQNRWWKLRMQQKTGDGYFSAANILKEKMLYGSFSDDIMESFQQIIEYFGSSPIIIRSSSLLEDGFGNAFAGKYESVFLANQGSPEQRYIQFAEAVKRIYASTMNEDALVYRKQRGLDKADEQMALLVQRVSGSYHKNYFFPDLAGVGVSHNTYVWNDSMDTRAGMLRLVFGLGTRAVNRVEGDYPRMVALDEPLKRPYSERDDIKKFSQHEVDVIDTAQNSLRTIGFEDILKESGYGSIDRIAVRDYEAEKAAGSREKDDRKRWILTLDGVLEDNSITGWLKIMLGKLEAAYKYPVEVEFTVNFTNDGEFKINLLQCRPLQTYGLGQKVEMPERICKADTLFASNGYFLGGNIMQDIKRVIYVDLKAYSALVQSDKYEVARIVGGLNRAIENREELPTLLIGPGRWGTTTPSLGVPVKFAEINNIAVLTEVASTSENLMPELSFGTHFFQDLVETRIFYVALFPEKSGIVFNRDWFAGSKDMFAGLAPDRLRFKDIISVYDVADRKLCIMSDVISQKIISFSTRKKV